MNQFLVLDDVRERWFFKWWWLMMRERGWGKEMWGSGESEQLMVMDDERGGKYGLLNFLICVFILMTDLDKFFDF